MKNSFSIMKYGLLVVFICAVVAVEEPVQPKRQLRELRRSEPEILDLNLYKSNIRKSYYQPVNEDSWYKGVLLNLINFKNQIPRYNLNFESVPHIFAPQVADYEWGVVLTNYLLIYIIALALLAFAVFLPCRFCCNKCGGTVTNYTYRVRDKKKFIFGLGFLFFAYVAAITLSLLGTISYFFSVLTAKDQMLAQAQNFNNRAINITNSITEANSQQPTSYF